MSKQLVRIEPAFEAEPMELDATGAVNDDYAGMTTDVATPLGEADEEALELGIASVFESLIADAGETEAEPTLALLAELNRLWAEPLAA